MFPCENMLLSTFLTDFTWFPKLSNWQLQEQGWGAHGIQSFVGISPVVQ
jgi:hypothetical protein